ncbi:glycosyl hydrolase [Pseudomonas sp. UL073]|uniref:Glycosyl hydrolase n=1 Tax=Zestomonas insulae TaxID=2809017 RepID=A0ABS2ID37_9GAMM|nr:YCF48-related protein [Pseudomonas insulae]MBM7061024.1 glycosyl hydrolase [Pseudomonas insulae]
MNWHHASAAFLVTLLCAAGGATESKAANQPSPTISLTTQALPPAHPNKVMLMSVAAAGDRLVSVGENGTIALSDDEGRTWRNAVRVPVSVALTNVAFASPTIGWAIGHQGVVLRSDDGGQSWTEQANGISLAQAAVDYWTREVAAGNQAAEIGLENARYLLEDGPEKPLLALSVTDEQHLTVVGAFGIAFKSTDGGKSWLPYSSLENEGRLHLYGITEIAGKTLIAGEQGLLLSEGQVVPSPYEGSFFGVVSDSETSVVAYGLRGNLAVSADGGAHWQAFRAGEAGFTCGIRLADGSLLLGNQAGQVFVRRRIGSPFEKLNWQAHVPLTGVVQMPSGDLVFSSLAGIVRLPASELSSPSEQNMGMNQ